MSELPVHPDVLIQRAETAEGERDEARAECDRLRAERDHWRGCHDGQVATKRRLSAKYGDLLAASRELAEAVEEAITFGGSPFGAAHLPEALEKWREAISE